MCNANNGQRRVCERCDPEPSGPSAGSDRSDRDVNEALAGISDGDRKPGIVHDLSMQFYRSPAASWFDYYDRCYRVLSSADS